MQGRRRHHGAGYPRVPAGAWALVLSAVLALLPAHGAAAQQRLISGTVTHRETAAPLPGVYVALESAGSGAPAATVLTDAAGRFRLGGLQGRRYRLRFERVGMTSERTDWFTVGEENEPLRIALTEEAVELTGLRVDTDARTCRLNPDDAVVVQRWWDDVRTALEVAAQTGASGQGPMRIEHFERELATNLSQIGDERTLGTESIYTSRPFRAQDPRLLAAEGFVQGDDGDRLYLAPDAAVLFSDPFLAHHCLAIAGGDDPVEVPARPGELQLSVRPTRATPTDIRGVLTIDTVAGELRSFDYRYVNLPDELPVSRAGGHLSFSYLPSGSWIVSDWWIRMPQLGLQRQGSLVTEVVQVLAGYVERGGRVVAIDGAPYDPVRGLGRATVRGSVFDSLTSAPLENARVSVVGTRLSTRTGRDGGFVLDEVPAGRRRITVHHASLNRLQLPSPTVTVTLEDGGEEAVRLVTPGFSTVAQLLCGEEADASSPILTGSILETVAGPPQGGAALLATWRPPGNDPDGARTRRIEAGAGSDGRYVACGLPADVPVTLSVRPDASVAWRSAGTLSFTAEKLTAQDLWPGDEAPAVILGRVTGDDEALPGAGARIAVVTVRGDTVAATTTDSTGDFELEVPPAVGYRAVARAPDHWPESSAPFTVDAGEAVTLNVQLSGVMGAATFELEELLVEVEDAQRARARRRLALFGTSPERLGRRWIGRATLDSLTYAGGDPGVAIQAQGIPGVRVAQEQRTGRDPLLCVMAVRARTPCAIIVLDGVPIDPRTALALDFRDLEGIAVLRPQAAMVRFGEEGRGGAVILWSRGARR
jgi:hypothetical protein